MPEVQISRQDIEELAAELQTLNLPSKQRVLLMAIFALAAEAIGDRGANRTVRRPAPRNIRVAVEEGGQLPSISALFVAAFTPGLVTTDSNDTVGGEDVVNVKIGR